MVFLFIFLSIKKVLIQRPPLTRIFATSLLCEKKNSLAKAQSLYDFSLRMPSARQVFPTLRAKRRVFARSLPTGGRLSFFEVKKNTLAKAYLRKAGAEPQRL
jgi:hypothetical protein